MRISSLLKHKSSIYSVLFTLHYSGTIKFIQLHNFAPILSSLSLSVCLFVYFSLRASCSLSWLAVMFLFFFLQWKVWSGLADGNIHWLFIYNLSQRNRKRVREWEFVPTSKRFKCCIHTHTWKKASCIRRLILKDAELKTTRLSKNKNKMYNTNISKT